MSPTARLGVAWSPDSRELAFASYAGPDVRTGRVAVVNADGSGFRVLSIFVFAGLRSVDITPRFQRFSRSVDSCS